MKTSQKDALFKKKCATKKVFKNIHKKCGEKWRIVGEND
jgi:hypothetical protein